VTEGNYAIRRVVTRVDEQDKAIVLFDDFSEAVVRPGGKVASNLIWATEKSPAGFDGASDAAARQIGISPPASGTIFRILDYPPASALPAGVGAAAGGGRPQDGPEIRGLPPRVPGMHRTKTLDYVIVLQGEIFMLLDDCEIHLKQGDVLVQQATNHAWVNRGTQTCRIAIVLVDSEAP
jgi:hypothetical protein